VPLPLLTHLWLAVASPAPAELAPDVDEVELPWALAQELRAAAADDPTATAPGPWVAEREIDLQAVEGGLVLQGRWTIVAEQAGWLAGELLGPGIELRSATLDGKAAPVVALPGATMLVAWIDDRQRVELRVRAFVPAKLDDRLALGLLPATRGRLRTAIPGRVAVPVTDDESGGDEGTGHAGPARLEGDVVWSGAPRLVVQLRDPSGATPPARETLAVAHVGVGLTVGDAEVRGRAHLQWALRQGTLSRVRATVAGVGDDLTVEGPGVATWSRTGDALDVELTAPTSGRVDLELRWTQAIGAGDEARLPLPRIEPDAWRNESSLQLARDGELEVIPAVDEGTAIAAAELPEWGQGLVEGTPTAAYQRGGSSPAGALELLRFVPVPGPPTVIDVADYTVATTEEGRVLMKVRYDLRNDRAAHLSVRPPPGLRIIGARVGLDTALPGKGDDGAWRIPLRRSLETVDGLLSFPVEVILLGEQEPWERRERRELPLPTLDAPIAAARVTLVLPPRYRSRLEPGERNVVDAFDEGEGLAYGKGVSSDEAAVADALLEEAVQGYLQNDFEGAQRKLEQIEALGVDNANVARLRSNIDVIEGKAEAADKGDVTMQRRVKEQAKARASEDFRRQEALIVEAEKAAEAGDYAEAEAQYQAALDLGGKLAKLEQSESVEQDTRNVSVEAQLSSVSKKKSKKGKRDAQTLDTKLTGKNIRFGSIATPVSGGEAASPGPAQDPLEGQLAEPVVASGEPAEPKHSGGQADMDSDGLPDAVDVAPEPTPDPAPPEIMADRAPDVLEGEPVVRRKLQRRSRGRASGSDYKRAPPRSRIAARRRAPAGTTKPSETAVTVYDFEDDTLDGEILSPEGANVASRARSTAAAPFTVPAQLDDGEPMLASRETQPRDAALPPPEVTASALSVIVPVTGQAVLYQQLLIEANQTQVIEIDARRRLRR
jgi:hypothetical protein